MVSTSGLKTFAYFLQIVCMLPALVLISFGVYVVCTYKVNSFGNAASAAYVVVGAAAIIILLWGYLSTRLSNVCCTVIFIIFLYLIITGQAIILEFLTMQVNMIAPNFVKDIYVAWENEFENPGAMAKYQIWFNCCGLDSAADYIINDRLIPRTCFVNYDTSAPDYLNNKGCLSEVEYYWSSLLMVFNIVGWVLIGLELVLSFVSCGLYHRMRKDGKIGNSACTS